MMIEVTIITPVPEVQTVIRMVTVGVTVVTGTSGQPPRHTIREIAMVTVAVAAVEVVIVMGLEIEDCTLRGKHSLFRTV